MAETDAPKFRLIAPVIPYRGTSDGRPIERAINTLLKLDKIHINESSKLRKSERFHCHSRPIIILPSVCDPIEDKPPVQIAYAAWTRNLSSTGISIVMSSSLMPTGGIDETVSCVDLKNTPLERSCVLVGLFGVGMDPKWIESHIVRSRYLDRLTPNSLELGIRFERQNSQEWPDADRLKELAAGLLGSLDDQQP